MDIWQKLADPKGPRFSHAKVHKKHTKLQASYLVYTSLGKFRSHYLAWFDCYTEKWSLFYIKSSQNLQHFRCIQLVPDFQHLCVFSLRTLDQQYVSPRMDGFHVGFPDQCPVVGNPIVLGKKESHPQLLTRSALLVRNTIKIFQIHALIWITSTGLQLVSIGSSIGTSKRVKDSITVGKVWGQCWLVLRLAIEPHALNFFLQNFALIVLSPSYFLKYHFVNRNRK